LAIVPPSNVVTFAATRCWMPSIEWQFPHAVAPVHVATSSPPRFDMKVA
jgi:hypothetical protein